MNIDIDLSDDLIGQAMAMMPGKDISEVVVRALEDFIQDAGMTGSMEDCGE